MRDQKQLATQAQQTARAQLSGQPQSAGLDFLRGEGKDTDKDVKRKRAAARKILEGATQDLKNNATVQSGLLKGKNAAEVAELQKSYDRRTKIIEGATGKQRSIIAAGGRFAAASFMTIPAGMATAMAATTAVARAGAAAINMAFGAIAFVGIVALVVSAAKEAYNFLFPLSDLEKSNLKTVEALTEQYQLLNEELARSETARETILSGADVQANIGQALQGIDVASLIDNINLLNNASFQETDGFEDLNKVTGTTIERLVNISSEFKPLQDAFKAGIDVDETTSKQLTKVSNNAINLGLTITGTARAVTDAGTELSKLGQSLVKETPLQAFIDLQITAIQGLEATLQSAQDTLADQENNARQLRDSILAQQKLIDAINDGTAGPSRRSDAQRIADVNRNFGGSVEERLEIEDALLATRDESKVKVDEANELFKEQALILGDVLARDFEIKENRKKLNKILAEAQEAQTLGLTTQGKLSNLELQRAKNTEALQKAQEKVNNARFGALETMKTDKDLGQEQLDAAEEQLRIAVAIFNLANFRVDQTAEQLQLEKQITAEQAKRIGFDLDVGLIDIMINKMKALGEDKTFSGAAKVRELTLRRLDKQLMSAESTVTAASAAYELALSQAFDDEARRIAGVDEKGRTNPLTQVQQSTAMDSAMLSGGVVAALEREAQAALNVARLRAEIETNSRDAVITRAKNEATGRKEALEIQTQGLTLTKAQEITEERLLQLRKDGVVPTQEELKGIKAQSAAIADLEIQLQNRKELEDSLKQNMDSAFESIITGAKSAKEAFADMAKGILADLAKVIARMIRMKIIEAGLSFLGMDTGGVTGVEAKTGRIMPAYAGGGYTSPLRNYSRGGMARGPQSGYNAVLHGNEAVVPLPDNRSIPVEFTGGGGGNQNNVTVNVSMNNDGTTQSNTQGDGNSAAPLGNAIARAVQAELQNQKRSGGLLSPYGAA